MGIEGHQWGMKSTHSSREEQKWKGVCSIKYDGVAIIQTKGLECGSRCTKWGGGYGIQREIKECQSRQW